MNNKTEELLLEVFSEESSPSLSTHFDTSSLSLQKDLLVGERLESAPSCLESEGEDTGKLLGVILGKVVDINEKNQALVDFLGNPSLDPAHARSTVHMEKAHIGQDVVLMFDQGNRGKPIIMGMLCSSENKPPESDKDEEPGQNEPTNVELDGERLTLTAKKEIVLKCGKASITLTKAGKILIRGTYLLSRSTGSNRIKGGAVQIN